MRILAFSDLHRDQAAARSIIEASGRADVLIGCGDFATRGEGAVETLRILRESVVPVVLVHGNHDDPDEIARFCSDWSEGHYLHGSSVTLSGVPFFGLGGEIPSRNEHPWNAAETEETASVLLADLPAGAVLVTHTPPHGTADIQRDGTHEGSEAIRSAIIAREPHLCLCGHIHNAWGMSGAINETRVFNLGPTINWFEI